MTVTVYNGSPQMPGLPRRALARNPVDGKLWVAYNNGAGGCALSWSADGGATWTQSTAAFPNGPLAFFIDSTGLAHLILVGGYYYVGTPTDVSSWINTTSLSFPGTLQSADVVAWRTSSGIRAAVALGVVDNSSRFDALLTVVDLQSSGAFVSSTSVTPVANTSAGNTLVAVDFAHTGDGLTPVGAAPSIWVAAMTGTDVRLVRTQPGQAGTVRTVATSVPATGGLMSAAFDGLEFVVAYTDGAGHVQIVERDAADTTTVTRTPPTLSPVNGLSVSYNTAQDIYLLADGASAYPERGKYARAAGSWGSWAQVEASSVTGAVVLRRSSSGAAVDAAYVTTADLLRFDRQPVNSAPTVPTWVTTDSPQDVNSALALAWQFNDPDYGDVQSAVAISRIVGANAEQWWDGSAWQSTQQWITTAAETVSIPAPWGATTDGAHAYYVQTKDKAGLPSPKSVALHITPSQKVDPVIMSGTSTTTARYTLTWTCADQSAWRVTSTLGDNIDWTPGAGNSETFIALPNGATVTYTLTTKNADGLASDPQSVTVTVAYTPPATPIVTVSAAPSSGALVVSVTNPTPTGDQPAVTSNDIYLDGGAAPWADGTTGKKKLASIPPNSSWTFYTPASNVDYAVTVAPNGDASQVAPTADPDVFVDVFSEVF